jgi:hypothetical protein
MTVFALMAASIGSWVSGVAVETPVSQAAPAVVRVETVQPKKQRLRWLRWIGRTEVGLAERLSSIGIKDAGQD